MTWTEPSVAVVAKQDMREQAAQIALGIALHLCEQMSDLAKQCDPEAVITFRFQVAIDA